MPHPLHTTGYRDTHQDGYQQKNKAGFLQFSFWFLQNALLFLAGTLCGTLLCRVERVRLSVVCRCRGSARASPRLHADHALLVNA